MNDSSAPLPDPLPKRANVGCGYDVRAGYLNVDLHARHGPDLVADVSNLSMLPSGYFEEILAQDVLEHLERDRTEPTLREWSRLLAPEGILHIRVPSLFGMFEMLAMPHYREFAKAKEVVHLMYGTQAYNGDYHLTGFTPALLDGYLRQAGLLICEASVLHTWLFDIKARKTDVLRDDGEFLQSAYFSILGRPIDPEGMRTHGDALASGNATREVIEDRLRNSEEARFRANHPVYLWQHTGQSGRRPLPGIGTLRSIARFVRSRIG